MVVLREPGEVFLLCHSGGDDAVCWVEQIDPVTLHTVRRSVDLAGGLAWPGGLAAHANGSIYVVFGRHAHRLDSSLEVLVSRQLPRNRPYNSFVILDDGSLATKDFGGARPDEDVGWTGDDTEVVILEPQGLNIVATVTMPEPSIARLSSTGNDIYVVGVNSLMRACWSPQSGSLSSDPSFQVRYREQGEGYGWDAVLAGGDAWFINNGEGSERFNGSLRGLGVATAAQALIRINLHSREVLRYEVHPGPGGIVANPPAIDATRGLAVGYDSGNAVVTTWEYSLSPPVVKWQCELGHGAHPLMLIDTGVVVLGDYPNSEGTEDIVFLDIETGLERLRVVTESPVQSVLFGAVGFDDDLYMCSFLTLTRIAFSSESIDNV